MQSETSSAELIQYAARILDEIQERARMLSRELETYRGNQTRGHGEWTGKRGRSEWSDERGRNEWPDRRGRDEWPGPRGRSEFEWEEDDDDRWSSRSGMSRSDRFSRFRDRG
jgi:hypothetical protein